MPRARNIQALTKLMPLAGILVFLTVWEAAVALYKSRGVLALD